MKIQIRRNTFETNSSSMHSLQILTNEDGKIASLEDAFKEHSGFELTDDGTLILSYDDIDFGWGFEVLTTSYEKLCYVIASICYQPVEGDEIVNLDTVLKSVQKVLPQVKSIQLPIDTYSDEKIPFTGHIDHDSVGTFNSTDVDEIASFIFEQKNYILVDNDNNPHTYQVTSQNLSTLDSLLEFLEKQFDYDVEDYDLKEEDGYWDR